MKTFIVLRIILISLCLTSCTKFFARQLERASEKADKDYPPAKTHDINLKKSVDIQLKHYKSVQTRAHQREDIAFAVSVSGGGYRAANLALGVLLQLEKTKNKALKGNLLQEVDYFSTVSGGGLGVGYYLTGLHNYLNSHQNANSFSLKKEVNSMVSADNNTPNPLRADLSGYLYASNKKGLKIEKILNDTILYTPEGGLAAKDMFIPENSRKTVQLPYWVTNSTVYQNAAIFPFAPDVLAAYRVRGFYHNNRDYTFNGSSSNPDYAFSMPISVGLMASMSVPFAMPATTLISENCDNNCFLQLFDGGVGDNLGVSTALNLLAQDPAKIKLLIVLDSGKDLIQPYSQLRKPPSGMTLAAHSATLPIDSNRKYLKSNLNVLALQTLCSRGASHVVVVYFDLDKYPKTQDISSRLVMSLEKQKLLLDVGQQLVKDEKTLQLFLSELSKGELKIGECAQPSPQKIEEIRESPKTSTPTNL